LAAQQGSAMRGSFVLFHYRLQSLATRGSSEI
jgi:hypothetical protein